MVDTTDLAALKQACLDRWDASTSERIVVFAQGKTGTSTIAAGLKHAGFDPVFQVHTLRPRALARVEEEYRRASTSGYPRHVWEGQWLGAHHPSEAQPWRIVTAVRDPTARIVSRFFQQTSRFRGFDPSTAVDGLVAELRDICRKEARRIDAVGWDWFEFDLEPVLGRSVYDTPFDPSTGYATIDTPTVSVLLLRNESLDRAPAALRAHFGRRIRLTSKNVGSTKDYASLYQGVLDRFRPPEDYVERVYETRQARHFYAAEELDRFRAHWTRPL